jgi:methionine-rich copper-binding protein CopC
MSPSTRRAAAAVGLIVAVAVPSLAAAHDGPKRTSPRAASTVDGVVDHVDIDFGIDVRDPAMQIYSPDSEPMESTVTQTGRQTVRLDFAPLSAEGEYVVSYVATAVDGHLFASAFGFNYGSAPGGTDVGLWVLFAVAAVAILGAGTWLSLRSARRNAAADDPDGTPVA